MKAIDVHAHFGSLDSGVGGLAERIRSGEIELVLRRAQAADIQLTVVSALRALMPYGGDVIRGNEDARLACEQHEGVAFWAVLDPRRQETYRQVEAMLSHPLCKGLKIHPMLHSYEIRDHGEAVFEFAAARRALILTHSGDPGSFPEDFVPFANRYPTATLILAHLGNSEWDNKFSRQAEAIRRADSGNIYIDTSSIMSLNSGLIEWAVSEIGFKRLLFGTDSPLYFAAAQKARVEFAEISAEARQAILFENAAALFGKSSNM